MVPGLLVSASWRPFGRKKALNVHDLEQSATVVGIDHSPNRAVIQRMHQMLVQAVCGLYYFL